MLGFEDFAYNSNQRSEFAARVGQRQLQHDIFFTSEQASKAVPTPRIRPVCSNRSYVYQVSV